MRKKWILFMLMAVMVFAFAGCGGSSGSSGSEAAGQSAAAEVSSFTLLLNTEGMGQFAYAPEGEPVVFDSEFPKQSSQIMAEPDSKYVIEAKADEGSSFVKWVSDGEDYSNDPRITVTVREDMELTAVFE